jgi:hypothetical protein
MPKPDVKEDRQARLAAALRANLRRRKDQARARQKGEDDEGSESDDRQAGG